MQSNNTKKNTGVKSKNQETYTEIMNRIHVYGSSIYLQTDTHTRKLSAPQYIRYVQDACGNDMTPAQVEQALDARIVDAVYDRYAAAPRGLHQQGGRRVLVTEGTDWIQSDSVTIAASDAQWLDAARRNTVLGILLAGLPAPQVWYVLRWIHGARARVKTWLDTGRVYTQMPILVLAGDEGCGKTLLLNSVLCPLVNGWNAREDAPARAVPAARPLLGKFNAEIVRSPLLSIDDEISGLTQRERAALFTACKSICYAQNTSIEGKGVTPVILSLPWCICICCNLSDDALKSTPYSADEANKVLAVRVERVAALPDNYNLITRADVEAAAALIDNGLPAVYENTPALRVTADPLRRQPVAGWIDPALRAGLRAISPEGMLMRAWCTIWDNANSDEKNMMSNWFKVSTFYEFLMRNARGRDVDALRAAVPTARTCGRLLKSLTASGLGKVEMDRHDKAPLYWLDIKAFRDETNACK